MISAPPSILYFPIFVLKKVIEPKFWKLVEGYTQKAIRGS